MATHDALRSEGQNSLSKQSDWQPRHPWQILLQLVAGIRVVWDHGKDKNGECKAESNNETPNPAPQLARSLFCSCFQPLFG